MTSPRIYERLKRIFREGFALFFKEANGFAAGE